MSTAKTPQVIAVALWAFAYKVGEADGELDRDEIKAAYDWLKSAVVSANAAMVKDAAAIALLNYKGIMEDLANHDPPEIFGAAKRAVSRLGQAERESVYLDFLLLGSVIGAASGGGLGRDPISPTERQTVTFLIDYMGGSREDVARAVSRISD